MEGLDLKALSELLKPEEEDLDSDEEGPISAYSKLTPASIGPTSKKTTEGSDASGKPQKESKNIWDEAEVQEGSEFDDIHDPRPEPEYDIVYKQSVSSEDMFLQMGNKTPATASCEDMVVKVKLPNTKIADVKLDVKSKFLDCRTPTYKLGLHLPHPVDSKSGKAQWDASRELLSVSLRMSRDYDFVNF